MNERKKVGIITLNGYSNYGNRLQNYALQEVVKDLGFSADTLIIPRNGVQVNFEKQNMVKKTFSLLKKSPINFLKKIANKLLYALNESFCKERERIFRQFSNEFISEKICGNSSEELFAISQTYDFFIVGSDQVWNPLGILGDEHVFFLTFADPKKRISYAASFSNDCLPENFKAMIKPWLLEMKALAVRERSGAEIIKKLTERNALVALDPTLLLSKEKWLSIARKGKQPKKKFILSYFLGKQTADLKNMIKKIAEHFDMDIVNLASLHNRDYYLTGPLEFVDYINSAELVITDSFHGMAFCIILETPFLVAERIGTHSMYSRIETLLEMFNLKDREMRNLGKISEEIFELDFSEKVKILKEKQRISIEYLKVSLST